MAVEVFIKSNGQTQEYSDALFLKRQFDSYFDKYPASGRILITSNTTLFGQEVKDIDLIVLGNLNGFSVTIKSKAKNKEKDILELITRDIKIYHFCFVIETKKHIVEDVELRGLNILVKYNNRFSDITTQSENQKYSLKNYLEGRLGFSPYICNFIWFRNVSWESIKELVGKEDSLVYNHNYLPNEFSFRFLIQLACVQNIPYNPIDGKTYIPMSYCNFNCFYQDRIIDIEQMDETLSVFQQVKKTIGKLTKDKIKKITSPLLTTQQYAQAIGRELVVISGKAGTGKTIKMLNIGCDLALNNNARVLILTYNNSLVNEIRRTLAFANIPNFPDSYAVEIMTLHKYVYNLLKGLELGVVKELEDGSVLRYIPEYIARYEYYLHRVNEKIRDNLKDEINIEKLQALMSCNQHIVAWDYILIDESQDWNIEERDLIYNIFGREKTIITDGSDQLIRNNKRCNWTQGLKIGQDFKRTNEKKSLRQKANLVSFVNQFAKEVGLPWSIEVKEELIGGKVIITSKEYNKQLHEEELNSCRLYKNTEYEMLFLAPPSLVKKTKIPNKAEDKKEFMLKEKFQKEGISIIDETDTNTRSLFLIDRNQSRLIQYDSCRGLEGWTVICLDFDEFINYKMDTYVEDDSTTELDLETYEEKRDRYVYLWSLIPLTRAIDTIIITLKNPNGYLGKSLRRIYELNPDYIKWLT